MSATRAAWIAPMVGAALLAVGPMVLCLCASPDAPVSHHCCPSGPALTPYDWACCGTVMVTASSITVVSPVVGVAPASFAAVAVVGSAVPWPPSVSLAPPPPSVLRI
jgi:hypothetical protein